MSVARNADTLETLTTELERNAGDLSKACYAIGTSTGWLKKWMRDDPKVEAAIKDAQDSGSAVLESAAIQRAVHGVKQPIFYKDEKVGSKRVYSDSLLIKLLESRKRDVYGKTVDINQNITVKHLSDDELNSKIAMLAERLGMQHVLAPPIEAEYEVIELTPQETVSVDDLL